MGCDEGLLAQGSLWFPSCSSINGTNAAAAAPGGRQLLPSRPALTVPAHHRLTGRAQRAEAQPRGPPAPSPPGLRGGERRRLRRGGCRARARARARDAAGTAGRRRAGTGEQRGGRHRRGAAAGAARQHLPQPLRLPEPQVRGRVRPAGRPFLGLVCCQLLDFAFFRFSCTRFFFFFPPSDNILVSCSRFKTPPGSTFPHCLFCLYVVAVKKKIKLIRIP